MSHHRANAPLLLHAAFTLVEMIVVMGVIVIITALLVPAFSRMKGSNDFTSATGGIASTLEQARAYAMANNTYVYVGIGEYLVGEGTGVSPRTVGTGELAVATVAARDGTRGYDVSNPAAWSTNYAPPNGGNGAKMLIPIDKLSLYDNVHLGDFGTTPPTTGNMARPVVADPYRLGSTSGSGTAAVDVTPFSWPLGTVLGSGQYNFTRVIQFDPQGVARIQTATNTDSIAPWMEIDLQPTHGTVAPTGTPTNQNVGDQAALIIDCMSGAVRVYRP